MWQTQDHNQDQSDLDKNDSVPLTTSPARSLAGDVVNGELASLIHVKESGPGRLSFYEMVFFF